jgi:hypothetical protein
MPPIFFLYNLLKLATNLAVLKVRWLFAVEIEVHPLGPL